VAGIPVTDVVVAGIVATAINPSATTDDQGLPLWRLFFGASSFTGTGSWRNYCVWQGEK